MTSLDFIGFYDPVTRLKSMKIMDDFEWRICSMTQHVVDDRALRLEADAIAEPLSSYDMLFVPPARACTEERGNEAIIPTSQRVLNEKRDTETSSRLIPVVDDLTHLLLEAGKAKLH